MAFWTAQTGEMRDPKRQYRFKIEIGGFVEPILWFAKKCGKPSFEVSNTEHKYLNHTFNFPGKTKWNPIEATLVDALDPDVAATLSAIVTNAGYHPPANKNDLTSMSKALSVSSLGNVVIAQVDFMGQELEKWTLHNAWINKVTYGDLDYGGEDMTEINVGFTYDWAELETPMTKGSSAAVGPYNGQKFWSNDGSTDPFPG